MSDNPYDSPQTGGKPGPMYPSHEAPVSPLAIISLVFGSLGIVLNCCCGLFGVIFGLVAIITGAIALPQINQGTASGRGMAIAGIVCGIIAIVLMVAFFVFGLAVNLPTIMQDLERM